MSQPVQRRAFVAAFVLLAIGALLPFLPTSAQEQDRPKYDVRAHYAKHEYQIPMRDGVKLFTAVYTPKDRSKAYPFLMTRTPYSVAPYGVDNYDNPLGPSDLFPPEGFIFVYQDVRGRMMSEGEFVNMRPHRPTKSGSNDTDESTDTYDTVEWLLRNVPNHNGRVGIYGISYPGFYAAAGIIDSHPAIKAASPQAAIGDWFVGDDFHHNGALFLLDAFDFFSFFGKKRPGPTTQFASRFEYNSDDAYDFFLRMGPIAEADRKYLKGEISFWKEAMAHGTYDEFWKSRNLIPHMKNVRTAVMSVAGWFDAEDPYGPIRIYKSIEKQNPGIQNTLVVGPWIHGGWSRTDGDRLGRVSFHSKTGPYYREKMELPFFLEHLKGQGKANLPEAFVFVSGSNAWRSFDAWPPKTAAQKPLFLQAESSLGFQAPQAVSVQAADSYLSDPAKPVPYTAETRIRRSVTYMVEDQRFAARRPDVLVYETPELTDDVTLVGPVIPHLFISSTGTDADVVVKLIDVFPNDYPETDSESGSRDGRCLAVPLGGYQMLVRGDVMRAKFRNSYEQPEPLVPNEAAEVRFQLPDIAHTFKRGHRIMVQIQSSWFPLVDRNPQTFVDIYTARGSDFQPATVRVYRSPQQPSRLLVNQLEEK